MAHMAAFAAQTTKCGLLPTSLILPRAPQHSTQSHVILLRRQPKFALRAGGKIILGVEPDLQEDERDIWATAGEDRMDEFEFGITDGAHSWHEGDDGIFIENFKRELEAGDPPKGFQGLLAWGFPFALITALAFQVPGEYLYVGTVLFIFAYIGIEMAKPDKPSNFEPTRYLKKD